MSTLSVWYAARRFHTARVMRGVKIEAASLKRHNAEELQQQRHLTHSVFLQTDIRNQNSGQLKVGSHFA